MDLKILRDCELGEAGKKIQLPASAAYKFIKQNFVEPYVPGHKPTPGRASGTVYQARVVLKADIEGLGKAGAVIRCNAVEADYLIRERVAIPERLATGFLRDLHTGNAPKPILPPSEKQLAEIELEASRRAGHNTLPSQGGAV